jgi:glycerol-3-phosphate cytidylyltransferase
MIRGITAGAFDLLHAGHCLMLKEAKDYCDHLTVCLQTDPTVDRPEKNKPVQTVDERLIQLEACRYVDDIVIYTTEDELYEILKGPYDVRIIGADWKGKNYTGHDLPIRTVFNTRDHNYSSTDLRKRIKNESHH